MHQSYFGKKKTQKEGFSKFNPSKPNKKHNPWKQKKKACLSDDDNSDNI